MSDQQPPDLSTITNEPFEYRIGERTLRVAKLSIAQIFGALEGAVKSQYILDAQQYAALLDPSERAAFMAQSFKDMPRGTQLQDMGTDHMATMDGIALMLRLAVQQAGDQLGEQEALDLIDRDNLAELSVLVRHLCSITDDEKGDDDQGNTDGDTAGN